MPDKTFTIRRKVFTIFGAKFHIYNEEGELLGFSKQKAFKLKEDIRIYTDETMTEERTVIKARSMLDISAAYEVVDARTGEAVGVLQRRGLKSMLRDASDRPVLLIAHSMGSVIAFESLWQLTHIDRKPADVCLVTMGSPLGQRYIQKRIKGFDKIGKGRYPTGIKRWINLTAVGDMTAVDPRLANDYREMVELGLINDIEDIEITSDQTRVLGDGDRIGHGGIREPADTQTQREDDGTHRPPPTNPGSAHPSGRRRSLECGRSR